MPSYFKRPLSLALGAFATASLGGCYYGDVNGASYASAGSSCPGSYYDGDPYAYDDGYGYNCYDPSDYGSGFVQIGFGGGWYDDYYYPGYGMWMFDNYRNRYPLRGQYLNYWGGRRAWWKHHRDRGDGHWNRPGRGDGDNPTPPTTTNPVRPGRPDGWTGRPGRPGDWNGRDRDHDGPRGTRPGRWNPGAGRGDNPAPPVTTNPVRPGRPDGWTGGRPGRPDGWTGGRGGDGGPRGTRPDRPNRGDPGAVSPRPPRAMPAPDASPRPAPAVREAPAPRGNREGGRMGRERDN